MQYPAGRTVTSVTDPYWKHRQLDRFAQAVQSVVAGLDARRTRKALDALDKVRRGELEWDSAEVEQAINKVRNQKTVEYLRDSLVNIRTKELPRLEGDRLLKRGYEAAQQGQRLAQAMQGMSGLPGMMPMAPAAGQMAQMVEMFTGPSIDSMARTAAFSAGLHPEGRLAGYNAVAASFPELAEYYKQSLETQGQTARAKARSRIAVREAKKKGRIQVDVAQEKEDLQRDTTWNTLYQDNLASGRSDDEARAEATKAWRQMKNIDLSAEDTAKMRLEREKIAARGKGKGGGKGGEIRELPKAVRQRLSELAAADAFPSGQLGQRQRAILRAMNRLIVEQEYTDKQAEANVLAYLDRKYAE